MQKDKNPHGFMVQSFNGKKKTVSQSRKHSLKTELTSSQTTLHRLERISSWSKMKQFAAIMFKFKDILLDIIKPKTINTPGQFVDMSLLQRRESSITKMYQQRCFQNKTNRLADGKYVSRKSNISKLDPFLDDHKVIRVGGRISQSRMEYKLKYPILLSKNGDITSVIIVFYHRRAGETWWKRNDNKRNTENFAKQNSLCFN